MRKKHVPAAIRREIIARSDGICAYCQLQEKYTGHLLTIEHIIPEALGGAPSPDNLCLACWSCNQAKGVRTTGIDPEDGSIVRLFHPNQEQWVTHFRGSDDGLNIIGITPTGRATVMALKLNHTHRLLTRQFWVTSGWHPPTLSKREDQPPEP